VGDTLLILLNAHWEPIPFTLPQTAEEYTWDPILDSADMSEDVRLLKGGEQYPLKDRSLVVMIGRSPGETERSVTPSQVQSLLSTTSTGPGTSPPEPSPI
jgi:glycogen operon protein